LLQVHRSARAERLVGELADVLAAPAADADPFAAEVVSVPSRGIERWLAQELSLRLGASADGRDGICANVVFPFPATVVGWATGGDGDDPVEVHARRPVVDPWTPSRLMWTLLDVVEGVDGLGAFGAHLAGERGMTRRLAALRHAAELFDRYAVHRPTMIRAWSDGDDVDGTGERLDDASRWQPRVWRAARERIGPSFAERVTVAVERLATAGPVPGLPDRLSLYGLTALPATYLEVLDALARVHDVHLFLLHPSPGLWDRLVPTVADHPGRPTRAADPTARLPHHPLVASWARDSRELQLVLSGRGTAAGGDGQGSSGSDEEATSTEAAPATLLARLQRDVRVDADPPGAPLGDAPDHRMPLTPTAGPRAPRRRATDTSLQVHACHGRLRQVEVLRDAVLGLMSDDPTIQPRDIVVMCPDVETFAPLIHAVFGADAGVDDEPDVIDPTDSGRLPDVRVRLADRALRQVNPLLRTVADLLLLPDGRIEASTLLDLARRQPVRSRFRFSPDDVDTIETWVEELGIRWGIHAEHRARHAVTSDVNTWRAGLDRLLLGVAVAEDGPRTVGGLVPFDDVEGSVVDLAGRLCELVDRIDAIVTDLSHPRPVLDWCRDVRDAASLLCAADGEQAWQAVQLDRILDELRDAAGGDDAPTVPVTLPELRSLLDDSLRGRPSRANHRSGDLTVCTLVPMRSVPYRVVCLLGLDDETFPRRSVPSGDDLIARHPHVGDRDPRTEDRQLLLDALLAARDHLVVTYRARDQRTNAPVPPAVPVAELLDAIDATARPADGHGTARELLVRDHPLRAADVRTFDPDDPFGFDPVALAGARARSGDPAPPRRFLDGLPAAAPRATTIEWADLVSFLDRPVKHYLRTRLGVSLRDTDEATDDVLPVDLGGLERWSIGTRLLGGAVADELDAWLDAERSRGTLPAGRMGEAALADIVAELGHLADAATADDPDRFRRPLQPVEFRLRLGDVELVGVIADARPDVLARVDYGRSKPKRVLKLWLPWLALQAQGRGREAVLVSRGKSPSEAARVTRFPAELDRAEASLRLERLVALYLAGQDEPLPIFPEASGAFARSYDDGRHKAIRDAGKAWHTSNFSSGRSWGDGTDPEVLAVFGDVAFAEVAAMPATDLETGPDWDEDEPGRFGRLALRLWRPLLADCRSTGVKA
jgi:exodeoxyribonuclease V gamma subunit